MTLCSMRRREITPNSIIDAESSYSNVTLALFKQHLKWDVADTSEDGIMTAHLVGATKQAESYTRRVIGTSTWKSYLPGFDNVTLDVHPVVQSSIVVKYKDVDNVTQTLSASLYTVRNNGDSYAQIEFTGTMPELYQTDEPVWIEFTAGYAVVPSDLLIAIHRQAADYFETRTNEVYGSLSEVLFGFHKALFPYKIL